MTYIEQEIVFRTESFYGRDFPLSLSAPLFRRLESTARPSVRMAIEGASTSVGAPPAWLERATDIRTLGFGEKNGQSVLHVGAPRLGEAAPKLFEQQSLWPNAASPEDTVIQVIGKIARAVRLRETGSDLFDRSLLKHFSSWSGLFRNTRTTDLACALLRNDLKSVGFASKSADSDAISPIDEQVTTNARALSDQTPSPRQVRVAGKLDMVRHSTRSFGLLLDEGDEIRGVLMNGTFEVLQSYLGKEITVLGKAIYRPSGTLLRIDAAEILPGVDGSKAFSRVRPSLEQPRRADRRQQSSRTGVAAFFGSWPGEETDRDLLKALEEVRD